MFSTVPFYFWVYDLFVIVALLRCGSVHVLNGVFYVWRLYTAHCVANDIEPSNGLLRPVLVLTFLRHICSRVHCHKNTLAQRIFLLDDSFWITL